MKSINFNDKEQLNKVKTNEKKTIKQSLFVRFQGVEMKF